jgi:putative colanic acid biosynthesis UDP-glucose lipid carrier transferase
VIDVYKFRTMRVAEPGHPIEQARKNDPRVTRVGKLLRRTSLDELPQLINVMRGEMSLVGPRPHALEHNHYYRERLDRYASRHRVKPGLTGWAQIHGLRGPTEDPETMRRRVQMDLYYIENWSLWLDLKIIAATPFVGFVNRNAF